ncbi:MAG TPA: Mur ligase domain-containing protein [Elusimicrobiota bacterium]|nr:Mur ligase domain-containing protein [Elusimicrobiota bacterium]
MPESGKVHFVGAAGFGVSALAQFHVMGGGAATGSDRTFDAGGAPELREKLEDLGVKIFPQDGSALDGSHAYAVASTAIEKDNKDLERVRALGLKLAHRADELSRHVAEHKSIAVAGTSGKSTVVAMIFEILEGAGLSPSVITGGALTSLIRRGLVGNAFRGSSDLLVVESDESDGTLVRYRPWLGVYLNVSKDHQELAELERLFAEFRRNSKNWLDASGLRAEALEAGPEGSCFSLEGQAFDLPVPGRHNVENALAAIAACRKAGVPLAGCAKALSCFQGVSRRFERVGTARGVEVVDDFAHNPVKVAAALAAAHLRSPRVHAVFQLHGFAPARFMRAEFLDAFASALGPQDVLWLPEIFYAGGTAAKDVSAADYARELKARGKDARFVADRAAMPAALAREARSGDLVLVMGARDPSLPAFARKLLDALRG